MFLKNIKINKIYLFITISFLIVIPVFVVNAQGGGPQPDGLIPCDGPDCSFADFMQLVRNVINFLIYIAIPISIILFSYAGFLYITAAGDKGKITQAHGIFNTVFFGLLITLSAWLIVNTIVSPLIDTDAGYRVPLE